MTDSVDDCATAFDERHVRFVFFRVDQQFQKNNDAFKKNDGNNNNVEITTCEDRI